MCDLERLGGGRASSDRETGDTATGDRGTGSRALRGVAPEVDADVERGITPFAGSRRGRGFEAGPVASPMPLELLVLQQRDAFLEELNGDFRRVAAEVRTRRFGRAQAALRGGELAFREAMGEVADGPITGDMRARFTQIFDEGYRAAEAGWDPRPYWRALYQDRRTRERLERARASGLLHFDQPMVDSGRAPRVRSFDRSARQTWEILNIDHAVARERNPFRTFDPGNLRVLPERYNQGFLQRMSGASPFPIDMAPGGDDLEAFVMRHQLSRRRRARLPTGLGALGAGAAVLLFGQVAHAEFSTLATRYRAFRRRRGRPPEVRVRDDYAQLDSALLDFNRVFGDRLPLEVNARSAERFTLAIERTAVSLERGGAEYLRIQADFPEDAAARELARDRLGSTVFLELLDYRHRCDVLQEEVQRRLDRREEYLQIAEEFSRRREEFAELLEDAMGQFSIHPEDALDLLEGRIAIASAYRSYVDRLERLGAALERVRFHLSSWINEADRRLGAP